MKIVAVTQRVDIIDERGERRDCIDQRLSQWLEESGYLPVAVPNTLSESADSSDPVLQNWLDTVSPSALLLSGGNDIGQDAPERDNTERFLLSWASNKKIPVLGICRGMQMMGIWAGASMKKVNGHVRTRHTLQGALIGTVNSFHNFSFAECPSGFEVLARAEDGEIEAIRHLTLPWQGWMWHPEREMEFTLTDLQYYKDLVG